MLKKDLVKAAAAICGHTEKSMREAVDALEKAVLQAVAAGTPRVMLLGLGALVTSKRGPKKARHMVTGEPVIVGPRRVVLLKPSDSLTAAANSVAA